MNLLFWIFLFYFAHRFMYKKKHCISRKSLRYIVFFPFNNSMFLCTWSFVFLFRGFFPHFFPTIITGFVEHVRYVCDYDVHKPLSARVPRPESSYIASIGCFRVSDSVPFMCNYLNRRTRIKRVALYCRCALLPAAAVVVRARIWEEKKLPL